jgi:peptide-N4-(N-acetyl-beta-glucosaminyl)asparagine amidase
LKSIRKLIPSDVLEESLPESLLKWFKNFMHWTPNQFVCSCTDTKNNSNGTEFMQTTMEEGNSWRVRKIEVHTCNRCGSVQLFPRYNDVLKIAEARTGRCGEWSILFGAILNSVSLEARIVHDYLDHCWNEVLLDGKWLHVDSTLDYPASLNQPYYYEQNWKKQYMYVLAFAADKIEDVTPRYTQQWNNVIRRRQELQQAQSINHPTSIADWQNFYSII